MRIEALMLTYPPGHPVVLTVHFTEPFAKTGINHGFAPIRETLHVAEPVFGGFAAGRQLVHVNAELGVRVGERGAGRFRHLVVML